MNFKTHYIIKVNTKEILSVKAFKYHEDHGGELSLGKYVSGHGIWGGDPQV